MAKNNPFQVRITNEAENLLDNLCLTFGANRPAMVELAIRYLAAQDNLDLSVLRQLSNKSGIKPDTSITGTNSSLS